MIVEQRSVLENNFGMVLLDWERGRIGAGGELMPHHTGHAQSARPPRAQSCSCATSAAAWRCAWTRASTS
jgi:hypothetical protein